MTVDGFMYNKFEFAVADSIVKGFTDYNPLFTWRGPANTRINMYVDIT